MDRLQLKNFFKTPIKIAEIGVEYGGFTDTYFSIEHEIHLIDMWQTDGNDYYFSSRPGQVEDGYSTILNKYGNLNNVKIVKMKSLDASKLYYDNYFDWIYIDADHSYQSVKEDIIYWFPKLKEGGMISGHDIDPSPYDLNFEKYGVNKAVYEIFGSSVKLTDEHYYKSWYVFK